MPHRAGERERPYRILSVFGTRPEAIKMAPLVEEIAKQPLFSGGVCVTAQHREMLDQVIDAFDLEIDYDLDIMKHGQTVSSISAEVLLEFGRVLADDRPDLVLVHGDTTTCFAAALSAFYAQIPVGHVEAGLRTYDRYSPFPEEMNRTLVGKLATLHFAPTQRAKENLAQENETTNVVVTGNTVIDALLELVRDGYEFHDPRVAAVDFDSYRVLLLTAHRRENLGARMEQIFHGVRTVVDAHPDVFVIYPVHKNPRVEDAARDILGGHPRILLVDPLDVSDMHNLIAASYLVMTDSGGLQEEAPALGKPVVVLRTETERPEAIEAHTAVLAGVEAESVAKQVSLLLDDKAAYDRMAHATNPYGDGRASKRICDAIMNFLENGDTAIGMPLHEFGASDVQGDPVTERPTLQANGEECEVPR